MIKDEHGTDGKVSAQGIECPDCDGVGTIGDCPDCSGTGINPAGDGGECQSCKGYGFLNPSHS